MIILSLDELHLKSNSIFFRNARFFGIFPCCGWIYNTSIMPTKNFKFRKIRFAKNWFVPSHQLTMKTFLHFWWLFCIFQRYPNAWFVIISTCCSLICWFEAKSPKWPILPPFCLKLGIFGDLASNQQIREQHEEIIDRKSVV